MTPGPDTKAIGERLAKLRLAHHRTSQEALAHLAGVTRNTIISWESGATMPRVDQAWVIAELFGITVDDLIGFVNQPTAEADTRRVVEKASGVAGTTGQPQQSSRGQAQ